MRLHPIHLSGEALDVLGEEMPFSYRLRLEGLLDATPYEWSALVVVIGVVRDVEVDASRIHDEELVTLGD